MLGGVNEIKDETNKNIEVPINAMFKRVGINNGLNLIKNIANKLPNEKKALEQAKEVQKEQWQREDDIRKHIEEREDTAWTRSVKDMINAGINPNLVNVQPAQSGGGITNSTGIDYSMYEAEMNKELELIKQQIQNNFQGNQNEKDRFMESITRIFQLGGILAFKK